MHRKTLALLAIATGLALTPAGAFAQGFLKIGDVRGEVTEQKLREKWLRGTYAQSGEWIEIESWTWGGGSASAPQPGVRQLTVVRKADERSEGLSRLHSERRRVPEAILVLRAPGSREPQFYRFEGLYITTYRPHSADHPTETISFNFTKVEAIPDAGGASRSIP